MQYILKKGLATRLGIALALAASCFGLAQATDGFTGGPVLCPFRALTGIPCPTCGTTRAIGALFTGRFTDSLALNPLGLITVLTVGSLLLLPDQSRSIYRTAKVRLEKTPNVLKWGAFVAICALGWVRSVALI